MARGVLVSSLHDEGEGTYLISSDLQCYRLQRGTRDQTWQLPGYVSSPGHFVVGGLVPDGSQEVVLLLDSCATLNVAGPGWQHMLTNIQSGGTTVEGVGGHLSHSDGQGIMTLEFVNAEHQLDPAIIDHVFGKSSQVKFVFQTLQRLEHRVVPRWLPRRISPKPVPTSKTMPNLEDRHSSHP